MDSILSCCLLFISFWMVNGTLEHFHAHKEKILEHYSVPKYHYNYGVHDGWSGEKKVVEHGGWNGVQAVHNYGWAGQGHGHKHLSKLVKTVQGHFQAHHPHSHHQHQHHHENNVHYGHGHGHNTHNNGWGWAPVHQTAHAHGWGHNAHNNGWGWTPSQPAHQFHGHVINHGHKHTYTHGYSHPIIHLPVIPSFPVTVKGYIGHTKF